MFDVAAARQVADAVRAAGAALTYRELDDLGHAHPHEEPVAILQWLYDSPAAAADDGALGSRGVPRALQAAQQEQQAQTGDGTAAGDDP